MLNNNKGFSLVELMVVVAIIGILAAVAVPNINKYMAASKQTEAKSNLSALYTADKAFFAEYQVYDAIFMNIGFAPEGKLRYNVGFTAGACALGNLQAAGWPGAGMPPNQGIVTSGYCGTAPANCTLLTGASAAAAIPGAGVLGGCVPGAANSFVAGASGIISNGTVSDQWTMSDIRVLTNTADGT